MNKTLESRLEKLETKHGTLPRVRCVILGDEADGTVWAQGDGDRLTMMDGETEDDLLRRACPRAEGEVLIIWQVIRSEDGRAVGRWAA